MPHRSAAIQDIITRQERMLRLAERDYGLSPRVIFAETGIPVVTQATWKKETAMPAWALVVLSQVIPDDLTSLMFEPVGKCVTSCDAPEGDVSALASDAAEYNVEYLRATDPHSESGVTISPRERARLDDIHRRMRARKVA